MGDTIAAGSLVTVIKVVSADPTDRASAEDYLLSWTSYAWRRLLFDLPTDARSFAGRFERSWGAVIDDLHQWCSDFPSRPMPSRERLQEAYGYLGLLLVTLVCLRHTDAHRHRVLTPTSGVTGIPARPGHDCAAICGPMFRAAPVREALRTIYAPDAWIPSAEHGTVEQDSLGHSEWQRIDFDTLRFHRHGTTSFILTGTPREASQGYRKPLALKCIIYPYLRMPTIVRATREYMSRYGVPGREVAHVARVWASSSSWILMDFVPGETLGDHISDLLAARGSTAPDVRLDILARYGRELFEAMADLDRAGLRHSDLSPSNIIVRDDDRSSRLVLIDLGVNYLYTHTMPGLEGPDAAFVAPEVRAGVGNDQRADLYSIGRLLIAFAGGSDSRAGPVPDFFYAETPILARFIEDLVDSEPQNRLLIFKPDPTQPIYPQLRTVFDEELAAVSAARVEHGGYHGGHPLRRLIDLFRPLSGAPGRQRRIWQVRRTQQLYRDSRRSMHVRWLLFWSWVSAVVWFVGAAIIVTWWLRDLEWDWGNQIIAFLQRAARTSEDEFPYLDALRAPDYPIPDHLGNLPVRMVAMSFLLVGARYYQNLFAGVTPLIAGFRQGQLSVSAVIAEFQIRSQSVGAFVLVMPPTLIQRDWWPIFTAIGILACFLTNWGCLVFARMALVRAIENNLSTVSPQGLSCLRPFSEWTPSAGFYAAGCWAIGLSVYYDFVRDVFVYAGAVTAINVILFYVIKCSGDSAADVRAGLGRAFLAAERLRVLSERAAPRQVPTGRTTA